MIAIDGLNLNYGERIVLRNLCFRLGEGELVILQGRSGSGKSTLLKLLYREIPHFYGSILLDGTCIKTMPKHVIRRKLGVIFQSFELLERKTALENVALAGEVTGMPAKEIASRAEALLDRVGLTGQENSYPHELSGGEQQRVAIARALLNRPKILLADEPTGNLDGETAADMLSLLKTLQDETGMAMLLVTHADLLASMPEARLISMENGRIVER
ncbi:cell division ATP-binding protein FtsE [Cohnella faecalis]|uniref:ABC transporter ATP-binding protein n=1 Tax=Cohnella faecalis TaxID=2315694 RepID=A0A398CYH4_9BACL|nr:ABC transporter ATP-binding protein [Cohnella faecalis]RIE04044.1 ABC transporter ATP-binding protein [Cohnella faecalis]